MTDEARSSDEAEIEAVFERLRAGIAGGKPGPARGHDGSARPSPPALARSEAER
jgi:hypothetical protein